MGSSMEIVGKGQNPLFDVCFLLNSLTLRGCWLRLHGQGRSWRNALSAGGQVNRGLTPVELPVVIAIFFGYEVSGGSVSVGNGVSWVVGILADVG